MTFLILHILNSSFWEQRKHQVKCLVKVVRSCLGPQDLMDNGKAIPPGQCMNVNSILSTYLFVPKSLAPDDWLSAETASIHIG